MGGLEADCDLGLLADGVLGRGGTPSLMRGVLLGVRFLWATSGFVSCVSDGSAVITIVIISLHISPAVLCSVITLREGTVFYGTHHSLYRVLT